MQVFALTGGIAAGKSTVARRFAELGAVVIDADALARAVVEPGEPALEAIRRRFGDAVVVDGALDRTALGVVVFGDDQARRDLEAITHPAIQARVARTLEEVRRDRPEAIVVYDIPLLVETKAADRFDGVIVAHASAAVRQERLERLRGMDASEAARRIGAQASDAERLAIADHVIDTERSLEETFAQVDAVWAQMQDHER